MLLVNMKQIDDNSKIGQFMNAKVAKYQAMDKPIEFESYLQKIRKRFLVDETGSPTGMRERTQGLWIGTQERYVVPGVGSVIVNYVDNLPNVKPDGTYDVKKGLIGITNGILRIVPSENPDKAFFLCEISSITKDGEISIVDRVSEDKQENDKIADASMVDFMVSHKSSPISPETIGSENIIRDLAAAWGVSDSENKPLPTIRKELRLNVHNSHKKKQTTKRGYDEFFRDINDAQRGGNAEIKMRKDIQLAIEKNKISHVETRVVLFPGTTVERELLRHRPTESDVWIDKLLTYLLANPDTLKELRDELYFVESMTQEEKGRNFDILNIQDKIEQVGKMKAWTQVLKLYKEECGLSEDDIPEANKMAYVKEKIIEYYKNTGN